MIRAIFDPSDSTFQRLECPKPEGLARYEPLKEITNTDTTSSSSEDAIKFFFALDLTQCVDLLPRLLGSVVETIRFLGPENCALSINSDDGTPEVLEAIASEVEALGVEYFFQTSNINPKSGGRIVGLAQLRNLALQPMLDDTSVFLTQHLRHLPQRCRHLHGRHPRARLPAICHLGCRHDLRHGLDICWRQSHLLRCLDLQNHHRRELFQHPRG